jgi:hypothetical protein
MVSSLQTEVDGVSPLTSLDVIESWDEVDELKDMPNGNLCSYCYTKKLATMQANKYGTYAPGGYQATYDYVAKST